MTIENPPFVTKTFRLTSEAYDVLENLVYRFSKEAQFKISAGKIVELALFQIADASLTDLIKEEQ